MTNKKKQPKKRYSWRSASRFTSLDPQIVGEELDRIRLNNGTHVTADQDPGSPLHDAFPWDDAQAAHEHRLEVARSILRSVRVVTTTEYAMGDPELRSHVLKQALLEFAALRRKYAELSELAIVFNAIDVARKEVA